MILCETKLPFSFDHSSQVKQLGVMKFFLLLTVLFFVCSPLGASTDSALSRTNGLLRFIAEQEGLRNFALGTVIKTRCSRYMPPDGKVPCKAAVSKMIETLDFDIIFTNTKFVKSPDQRWTPGAFVFVAFKKNLISLLSDPKTATYLNDLNQKLFSYVLDVNENANVWDITKSHYKTDYKTSQVIAALFQDTSMMKLHLHYLDQAGTRGNASFQSNKELLGRVIDTINLILDSSVEHYRGLFYPPEIQKDLNRNIYHFYVPHYLSKALEKQGIKKHYAYSAALMLTLSYEFVTTASDYRYLYVDPKFIDNDHKIKDIYGGYCGSNIGVGRTNFFKSFEVIKASFLRSTSDSVELLIRH